MNEIKIDVVNETVNTLNNIIIKNNVFEETKELVINLELDEICDLINRCNLKEIIQKSKNKHIISELVAGFIDAYLSNLTELNLSTKLTVINFEKFAVLNKLIAVFLLPIGIFNVTTAVCGGILLFAGSIAYKKYKRLEFNQQYLITSKNIQILDTINGLINNKNNNEYLSEIFEGIIKGYIENSRYDIIETLFTKYSKNRANIVEGFYNFCCKEENLEYFNKTIKTVLLPQSKINDIEVDVVDDKEQHKKLILKKNITYSSNQQISELKIYTNLKHINETIVSFCIQNEKKQKKYLEQNIKDFKLEDLESCLKNLNSTSSPLPNKD